MTKQRLIYDILESFELCSSILTLRDVRPLKVVENRDRERSTLVLVRSLFLSLIDECHASMQEVDMYE